MFNCRSEALHRLLVLTEYGQRFRLGRLNFTIGEDGPPDQLG